MLTILIILDNTPVTAHKKMSRNYSDNVWVCAICLLENTDTDCYRLIKCKHKFHLDCLFQWIDVKCIYRKLKEKRCPYCRTIIEQEDELIVIQHNKIS